MDQRLIPYASLLNEGLVFRIRLLIACSMTLLALAVGSFLWSVMALASSLFFSLLLVFLTLLLVSGIIFCAHAKDRLEKELYKDLKENCSAKLLLEHGLVTGVLPPPLGEPFTLQNMNNEIVRAVAHLSKDGRLQLSRLER